MASSAAFQSLDREENGADVAGAAAASSGDDATRTAAAAAAAAVAARALVPVSAASAVVAGATTRHIESWAQPNDPETLSDVDEDAIEQVR